MKKIRDRDMPSHKTNAYLKYTPLLFFRYLQLEKLSPIETSVLSLIAENTYNFTSRHEIQRYWVTKSVAEVAEACRYNRQHTGTAIKRLISIGIIESKQAQIKTKGGEQKASSYRIVSNEEIEKICDDIERTLTKRENKIRSPFFGEKTPRGERKSDTLVTESVPPLERNPFPLVTYFVPPLHDMSLKFKGNSNANELLININKFLIKLTSFENSFIELYSLESNSNRQVRNYVIKTSALIRQFGLFSVLVGMIEHLYSKDANLVNFERLATILSENKNKFEDKLNLLLSQVEKLYFLLDEYEIQCNVKKLDFQKQAFFLLASKKDDSSFLSIYDDFIDDAIKTYIVSSSADQFKEFINFKLNLFFKAKILGHKRTCRRRFD